MPPGENTLIFGQLSPRERYILFLGIVIGASLFVYAFLWIPLVNSRTTLDTKIIAQEANLQWMQQAAQEIQQLRGQSTTVAAAKSAVSLLTVIDNSNSQTWLATTPKRIEPKTEEEILVEFEQVSFTALMRWLVELYNRYQIQVGAMSVERLDANDNVKVRVTLVKNLNF